MEKMKIEEWHAIGKQVMCRIDVHGQDSGLIIPDTVQLNYTVKHVVVNKGRDVSEEICVGDMVEFGDKVGIRISGVWADGFDYVLVDERNIRLVNSTNRIK